MGISQRPTYGMLGAVLISPPQRRYTVRGHPAATPLPKWGREHYEPYEKCVLIETDESDLPSKTTPAAQAKRLLIEKGKIDQACNHLLKLKRRA